MRKSVITALMLASFIMLSSCTAKDASSQPAGLVSYEEFTESESSGIYRAEWQVEKEDTDRSEKTGELVLACQEHPGVPGYDITYELKVYIKNRIANAKAYKLSSDTKGVTFEGNKATVPWEIVEKGDPVILKAVSCEDEKVYDTYPLTFKKWETTLNDDFDGDKLNTEHWSVRSSWPSERLERTNPANAWVEDGKLVLRAAKLPYEGAEYSHIFLETKNKFTQTYGCFTASVKVADKGGTNTAFWLLPNEGDWGKSYLYKHLDSDAWCGEIDILETSPAKSWNNTFQTTLHNWGSSGESSPDWHERHSYGDRRGEYNEYSCVWTKNALFLYFNGKLLHSVYGIEATDNPAYILLDLELGAHKSTEKYDWCGTYTDADLPIYAYVDFVRVYR